MLLMRPPAIKLARDCVDGTRDYAEAERYLIHRINEIRKGCVYGVRPVRIFREAATKYLLENRHLPSIEDFASILKIVDPYVGDLPLKRIHDGTVARFVQKRLAEGRSPALSTLHYSA